MKGLIFGIHMSWSTLLVSAACSDSQKEDNPGDSVPNSGSPVSVVSTAPSSTSTISAVRPSTIPKCASSTSDESEACSSLAPMELSDVSQIVVKPGDLITVTGQNFRSTMSVAANDMLGPLDVKVTIVSGTEASIEIPQTARFGLLDAVLTQEGVSRKMTLLSNGGKTDFPVVTAPPNQVCTGTKFYDLNGALQEGSRACGDPAVSAPTCQTDGAVNCVVIGPNYAAASTAGIADKLLNGQTVGGVGGTVSLPPPSHVLTSVTYGSANSPQTGALTLAAASQVRMTNGAYGIGGSGTIPTLSDCAMDGGTGCVAVTGFRAANMMNVIASDIKNGTTIAGVMGTASITPACTSDGQVGCTVNGVFKSANISGVSSWDLRIGTTLGGIMGALKTNCRNSVNSSRFNYDGSVNSLPISSVTTGTSTDYWDTVDDYYGWSTNRVTAWSEDTLCDASIWDDRTTTNGGAVFTTCGTSSTCIFRDRISNVQVTGVLSSGYNTTNTGSPAATSWNTAVQACAASTYGGYAAGTWRLPTQKELMSLYGHGLISKVNSNFMTLSNTQSPFWSSSSVSSTASVAYQVYLANGYTSGSSKTNSALVICVR
jgi:hypothetical protein